MHEDDRALIELSHKSKMHTHSTSKHVPWLQQGSLISAFGDTVASRSRSKKLNLPKKYDEQEKPADEEQGAPDQETQMLRIEAEFGDVQATVDALIAKNKASGVTPLMNTPVYSATNLEGNEYTRVRFDRNPAEQIKRHAWAKDKRIEPLGAADAATAEDDDELVIGDNKSAWQLSNEAYLREHEHERSAYRGATMYAPNAEEDELQHDFVHDFELRGPQTLERKDEHFFIVGTHTVQYCKFQDAVVLKHHPVLTDQQDQVLERLPKSLEVHLEDDASDDDAYT